VVEKELGRNLDGGLVVVGGSSVAWTISSVPVRMLVARKHAAHVAGVVVEDAGDAGYVGGVVDTDD